MYGQLEAVEIDRRNRVQGVKLEFGPPEGLVMGLIQFRTLLSSPLRLVGINRRLVRIDIGKGATLEYLDIATLPLSRLVQP